MEFPKKTIRDIDLKNKTVLVRAPLNVPIENNQVGDQQRLEAVVPTLRYLHEQNSRVILMSHHSDKGQSLAPVAPVLSKLLDHEIRFVDDCIGEKVEQAVKDMPPHGILMLENLRFHPEEEKNDAKFAEQLAKLGEIYINDDFTATHRAHASIDAITKYLPAVAGLQVEKEVTTITSALEDPERPLAVIIGGAKIATKIDVLEQFMAKADVLVIGGSMANNFFKQQGYEIGKSAYDADGMQLTEQILSKIKDSKCEVYIPDEDVMVGHSVDDKDQSAKPRRLDEIKDDELILDIGPKSMDRIKQLLSGAKTIIWNGPLGMIEIPAFRQGSRTLADAILASGATSIIGGGDTDDFINDEGLHGKFTFASTGGGAALELMAGKRLPGVEALLEK